MVDEPLFCTLPHWHSHAADTEPWSHGAAGPALREMARRLRVPREQFDAEGRCVQAWQVLALTEQNFHPAAPLAHALATLQEDDSQRRDTAARLLAVAFDPCFEFEVLHA